MVLGLTVHIIWWKKQATSLYVTYTRMSATMWYFSRHAPWGFGGSRDCLSSSCWPILSENCLFCIHLGAQVTIVVSCGSVPSTTVDFWPALYRTTSLF